MMNFPATPVFVVGAARSGTSLVYSILMSSGMYARYAAETHLLRTCADKYGPLHKRSNFDAFMHDWLLSKQFRRSGLDPHQFAREAAQHRTNYYDFLGFFMAQVAVAQKKSCWAENTPNHVLEVSHIASFFPDAKVIHVIRDGRAVAASLNRLNWVSCKHPALRIISAGIHWETQVQTGRREGRILGNRYLEIRYENLIQEPDVTLARISEFIGVVVDRHLLDTNPCGAVGKSNSVYGVDCTEEGQLFSLDALTRWVSELSANEQGELNTVIGETLDSLGYQIGDKRRVPSYLVTYCKMMYHLKNSLRHKTYLGRYLETGLELHE